jgi:RES domain-containing protein
LKAGPRTLWRIGTDTQSYLAEDLTGKGAEKTGGRWNKKGTAVLYTSPTIALAALETMVHLGGSMPLPLNRYLVKIEAPEAAWLAAMTLNAPVGWDAIPPGRVSIDAGTDWCDRKTSLLAFVPSVVVPEETNVLINPRHPQASTLRVTKVRKWTYDVRVWS